MQEYEGIVKEIFIPDKDVMNSKLIGFKILIDNKLYQLKLLQDNNNTKILREDKVKVIIKNINNNQIIEIEKCENYE